MFKKVDTKEIKNIRERLESELKFEEDLPYQRREEVKALKNYLNTWIEWKEYRERERYREIIKSES